MSATHFYTTNSAEASAAVANMNAIAEGEVGWIFTRSGNEFIPMYRMVHPAKSSHLLTTFIDERDAAINEEGYQGEGIGFWCLPLNTTLANVTPLYRAYDPKTDDHFYTINAAELGGDYKNQGVACFVFTQPANGAVPLYRFLSPSRLQHFYTTNPDEILGEHYTEEGNCGFVLNSQPDGPQPFFRAYHPTSGGHLYTLSIAESDLALLNLGYRGDGIAGYLWPNDGLQPGRTTQLYRARNNALDDHFYTTSQAEYENATQHLGYVAEGIAGWVLDPDAGPVNPNATPFLRFRGSFANDFFLFPQAIPVPLVSNSNFTLNGMLGAAIAAVVGLQVDIDITADLTVAKVDMGDLAFSFQLNAFSPQSYISSAQQYAIYFDKGEIYCEIQNYAHDTTYAIAFVVGSANLCHIGGNTLKAGYRLRIQLLNDDFANILGADFYVFHGNNTIGHHQLLVKNFPNGAAFGSAPIVGFQLVLVGYADGSTSTFAPEGAGLITYTATVPLSAATQAPPNISSGFVTDEQSNSTYGQMASTKSKTLTQTFGVGA